MANRKTKSKDPSVMDGVTTTASALKQEVMELVETALKKLESGLSYLEKELHNARTHQISSKQKPTAKKNVGKNKSSNVKKGKKRTSAKKR